MAASTKLAAVLLVVALTACSSGDDDSAGASAGDNSVGDNSAGDECVPAPDALVAAIADGLTNPSNELHDAQMVEVPPGDGTDQGYPQNIVAANITGPDGADPSAVGLWAVRFNTPKDSGPIIALNPRAMQLTDWGAAIQEGSPMAENRDIMASLDSTAAARGCLP
jgi:hypothetical protein